MNERRRTMGDERKTKDGAVKTVGTVETAEEKDERLQAGGNDRVASRKATEGSRGKRRRGRGLDSEGSP